jgi:HlyD family secretion protein
LEPTGGIIEISAIPGDVLKGFAPGVETGAVVDAESELGRVESYDLRATQLEAVTLKLQLGRQQRAQEIAAAQASYEQAIAAKAEVDAKLEEIMAQGEALATMQEAVQIAQADYQSLVELQATDAELVTDQELRRHRHEAERAAKDYQVRARTHAAALKAAEAGVAAATEGVRVAKLNVELAEQIDRNLVTEVEKKVAEETLEQSILRAPPAEGGSGKFTILKTYTEPGEFVTQVPILQVGDLSRMSCIAEVYEADVKEIADDQRVTLRSPAFAGSFADGGANGTGSGGISGRVVRVGSLVSSPGLIQRNPLAPSDRSIVEVEIAIEGETAEETARATAEAARHVGLQVTVQFGEKLAGNSPGQSSAARAAEAAEEAP